MGWMLIYLNDMERVSTFSSGRSVASPSTAVNIDAQYSIPNAFRMLIFEISMYFRFIVDPEIHIVMLVVS